MIVYEYKIYKNIFIATSLIIADIHNCSLGKLGKIQKFIHMMVNEGGLLCIYSHVAVNLPIMRMMCSIGVADQGFILILKRERERKIYLCPVLPCFGRVCYKCESSYLQNILYYALLKKSSANQVTNF